MKADERSERRTRAAARGTRIAGSTACAVVRRRTAGAIATVLVTLSLACASQAAAGDAGASAAIAATPAGNAGGAAAELVVDARSLRARIAPTPWRLAFTGGDGSLVLAESQDRPGEGPGALGFRSGGAWAHATRAIAFAQRAPGGAIDALLETDDPDGRRLSVQVTPAGDGIIAVRATVVSPAEAASLPSSQVADADGAPFIPAPLEAIGIAWETTPDERFFGLGERADRAEHRGTTVESYVSDGPYQPDEFQLIQAILPQPGFRPRSDATYFPIPWTLSSRGYGVLVDNDETVLHRLADPQSSAERWSFEVRGAPEDVDFRPAPSSLAFRVFAGPNRPTRCGASRAASAASPRPPRRGSSARGTSPAARSTSRSGKSRRCAPPTRRSRSRRRICTTCPAAAIARRSRLAPRACTRSASRSRRTSIRCCA